MEKKKFGFYQDVLVRIWKRQNFDIEAETEAEAIETAKQYSDEDVSNDHDVYDTEFLFETETGVSPSENNGYRSIEVFQCASAWPHKPIANNAIKDFKPKYWKQSYEMKQNVAAAISEELAGRQVDLTEQDINVSVVDHRTNEGLWGKITIVSADGFTLEYDDETVLPLMDMVLDDLCYIHEELTERMKE